MKRTGRREKKQGAGAAGADRVAFSAAPVPQDRGFSAPAPADHGAGQPAAVEQVTVSNLSLHDLFELQARTMLESPDVDEEQKQSMLVAMACPCCGGGSMSYSVKLKR